jgi:RNA polymerase sigma factor (sigma-70 family)
MRRLTEPTDATIVVASLSDPDRFAVIFERHYGAIHRYLQRRLGLALAEDLAAQTFVEAFAARGRYDQSRSDARPWLLGIATNLVRHHWRKETRALRAYARTGEDPSSHGFEDEVIEHLDQTRAGPLAARAVAALDRRDRDVLLLFAWEESSYEEIAAALEIPIGTVRSRLARARRQVRELLGPAGQDLLETPSAEGGAVNG